MPGWRRIGTRKSRAPSGVPFVIDGVHTSTKPMSSIARRIAAITTWLRRRLRCMRSLRMSSHRYFRRSTSSTSSPIWNGSGVERDRIFSASTWISISPVGRFGFTASGARLTTSPSAWSTNSLRTSCATCAGSGACSGLTTSCTLPLKSRRSTNTSPPWSRRVSAQPATVTRVPTSAAVSAPQVVSRQLLIRPRASERPDRPRRAGGRRTCRRSLRRRPSRR